MATTTAKLLPNPNRGQPPPVAPLETLLAQKKGSKEHSVLWNGQRVLPGGRLNPKPPSESRVAKEALYRTGAERIYARKPGTGRPLNEPPKKSGAGGHNWGWAGIEVGVELATKEELREIEREFNPTAPDPDEEPREREEGEEEWAEGDLESGGYWSGEGLSGWETMIAGNTWWPGYSRGIESVRTLFGDEPAGDEFNADEEMEQESFGQAQEHWEESDENRRVALSVGGPPQWSEGVAWGDREASKALEGVPVIPWGEEVPHPAALGKKMDVSGGRAPAMRSGPGSNLPEEGPLGLEAEFMTSTKDSTTPANFDNKDIIIELKREPGLSIGGGMGGQINAREKIKMQEAQRPFDIADTVSLPSS